jgi:hypothetical protein
LLSLSFTLSVDDSTGNNCGVPSATPMTPTICATLEPKPVFFNIMDCRNANKAGCPLPSIPRRTSSSRSAHTYTLSGPSLPSITGANMPATLVVHPPTSTPPPATWESSPITVPESDSSSSSSQSTVIMRSKRVRGQRSPPRISEEPFTLPPPATRSKLKSKHGGRAVGPSLGPEEQSDNETSPALFSTAPKARLNFETIPTRHVSESHVDTLIESQPLAPPTTTSSILPTSARLLRKKSGEPIKSSLKSKRLPPVITTLSSTKSEPSTPTQSKFVHFDAHLEHVKLFLAEQKPLAVSRDGSPTDTSGTDNEFPAFIYGHSSDEGSKGSLVMRVTNMRKKIKMDADVVLLELVLSEDSMGIRGRVRVKNIAFEKRLAVRFTFDLWQTTSEVTAKYMESVEDNAFDIFGFIIRLNDIMASIEAKTLFLALRYTVAGKEIWDNNGGENYLAMFTRSKVQPPTATTNNEDISGGDAMTHLKSKLEQVAHGREGGVSFLAQRVHRQARLDAQKPPPLRVDKSLSARYDFSASLKNNSWKAMPPTPPHHIRASTYPSSSSSTIPWPQKTSPVPHQGFDLPFRSPRTSALGSPGLGNIARHQSAYADSDVDDPPYRLPPPRQHHQRGYFDRPPSDTSRIELIPPGTRSPKLGAASALSTSPSLPRTNSFPPSRMGSPYSGATFMPAWVTAQHLSTGGSEDSTPSISSPSSSSTSSPSLSPTEEFKYAVAGRGSGRETSPGSPSTCDGDDNYSSFLNRCVYVRCVAWITAYLIFFFAVSAFTLAPAWILSWKTSLALTRHQVLRSSSTPLPLVHSGPTFPPRSTPPFIGHPAPTNLPEVAHLHLRPLANPVYPRPF